MSASWWVGFAGPEASFRRLKELWPDLEIREEEKTILLGGKPVDLRDTSRHEDVARFTDLANAVLLLDRYDAGPIKHAGPVYYENESGLRHPVLLAEPGSYSMVVHPIILGTNGFTDRRQARPLTERVTELCSRSDHFRKAAAFLADAGHDLREIFKAMEAIEKGHNPKGWTKDKAQRAALCRALNTTENQWEALRRTCRPARHAYPHDMNGLTYNAVQARAAVHHALKVWLEREVPL